MILPFSTQLNGKPTYFVERILKGLSKYYFKNQELFIDLSEYYKHTIPFNVRKCHLKPKIHTIRTDEKDRWKSGILIDFFINCRQKNMFRFAPRVPVVSVQKFDIIYDNVFGKSLFPDVLIDGIKVHPIKLDILAQNDGFDTVEAFFEYFNEDYVGKIIHWTDFKY